MNNRLLRSIITTSLLFSLAACGQQSETSVAPTPDSAASLISASSANSKNAVQVLESNDKKIRITVPNGQFSSAGAQADLHPSSVSDEDLTLLQHDPAQDITLYTARLGKPKSDAATYFKNLKTALTNTEGLSDVDVGAATENRMNYRFVQTADENPLRENCIAIYEAKTLYSVCANSSVASTEALMVVLKDVTLVQSPTITQ